MKFGRDSAWTGGVGDPETTDLDRRAQDAVKLNGVVKEVDYTSTPPKYRVAFGDANDEDNYILTDWLPAAGGRAKGDTDTHFLEIGEKVAVMSEGGELSTGQVIPAGTYTNNADEKAGADKAGVWRKKFKNGATIEYDRNTGAMVLDATGGGNVTMKGGGCSIVLKDGTVTIDGKLQINGASVKHNAKSIGDSHKHGGVTPGGSDTDVPSN